MSDNDHNNFEDIEPKRRDRKIDEAKKVLLAEFFPDGANQVFYGRQLEIWLEDKFFHWITKKALNELAGEHKINLVVETHGDITAHMYVPRRHRYPRRQIGEVIRLIAEFSQPTFTRALGQHGEMLADGAFAHTGFRILKTKVSEVDGNRWTRTRHDLDRLIERDGVRYGIEIKKSGSDI